MPPHDRDLLVAQVLGAREGEGAVLDEPEHLLLLDELLRGGQVASGVARVVGELEDDLPLAGFAFLVGLGDARPPCRRGPRRTTASWRLTTGGAHRP